MDAEKERQFQKVLTVFRKIEGMLDELADDDGEQFLIAELLGRYLRSYEAAAHLGIASLILNHAVMMIDRDEADGVEHDAAGR